MRAMGLAAMLALGIAGSANAQDVVHWSAPAAPEQGRYGYFPMGTPLRLTTRTDLSTRANRAGDRFYLTVAEPLVDHGQTVVPAGALAVGEVMRADRSAALGKRGQMAVRLLYVQTPSGPVALSGKAERAGTGQEWLAIGGAAVIAWPMAFIHGTSARLPADTVLTAYLADDLRFPVSPPAPAMASGGGEPMGPRMLPARFDPSVFSGVRQ